MKEERHLSRSTRPEEIFEIFLYIPIYFIYIIYEKFILSYRRVLFRASSFSPPRDDPRWSLFSASFQPARMSQCANMSNSRYKLDVERHASRICRCPHFNLSHPCAWLSLSLSLCRYRATSLVTLSPLPSFERDRPSFYGFLFLSAPPPLDEGAGRNETIGEIYVSTALKIVN